jgi:hypothetical protein
LGWTSIMGDGSAEAGAKNLSNIAQ